MLTLLLSACEKEQTVKSKLFTLLSSASTNITFKNTLPEITEINTLTYQYFYNGGGIAIGDINNDGLPDIYFTGNRVPNALYLNRGNMQFEDITKIAGVSGKSGWTTGVTMADVNSDDLLDIYVSRSGKFPAGMRKNELFINNGDLTFTERADEYGLADPGYSTQAAFFDYDRDGDIDMYLMNHAIEAYKGDDLKKATTRRDPYSGDKLYRNDGVTFTEVGRLAGIHSSPLGYGLGISIGDLNNDGWPDIYVGNDFLEHDYMYINNGNGTFTERLKSSIKHTSNFSMGTDIADFNNDGWLDIMVTDMVAEDNYRQKTNMAGMDPAAFNRAVNLGFHYQYMINTLQLNNGNGSFSEIAQIAGVSHTDWSWATLLMDLNNDGFKDIFITNGLRRDYTNKDYLNYLKNRYKEIGAISKPGTRTDNSESKKKNLVIDLLREMPSTKIENYVFQNNGNLTFSKKTSDWGLNQPSFSNGASYADLDNDGDLDLVINNIDEEAFVYENNSREQNQNHYLRIELTGSRENPDGLGTRVKLRTNSSEQIQELYLTRGFQSSVERTLHFGLGEYDKVNELNVIWPDGKTETLTNINVDQILQLDYKNSAIPTVTETMSKRFLFTDLTRSIKLRHKHSENIYDDFRIESLLPHKMSNFGPGIAVGDVNGDDLEDFYIGGAKGFSGSLYLQKENNSFQAAKSTPWVGDKNSEDIGAVFFDADNDGDLDLYVVSGGNEFKVNSIDLQDRLYINDSGGSFKKSDELLPKMLTSGSVVVPGDYDNDGDLDLFVGGRLVPGKYPYPPQSYILKNDNGVFSDVTSDIAPDLNDVGMVTAASWSDFSNDGKLDLIVVGEWMPLTMMKNVDGKFADVTAGSGLKNSVGWWYSINSGDFDNDGDMDYVAGNLGLNYKYEASTEEPFHVYADDFDANGSLDIVLGYYNEGDLFPLRGRQCSSDQMPFIKEKFQNYDEFGSALLIDVYGEEGLTNALHYEAKTFASSYIENLGDGTFRLRALPISAQLSSINGILTKDFDNDGIKDLVVAGNLYASEVETPRNDAGIGLFLKGNNKGDFEVISTVESGFYADGDVKGLTLIKLGHRRDFGILVPRNDDYLQLIKVNNLTGI